MRIIFLAVATLFFVAAIANAVMPRATAEPYATAIPIAELPEIPPTSVPISDEEMQKINEQLYQQLKESETTGIERYGLHTAGSVFAAGQKEVQLPANVYIADGVMFVTCVPGCPTDQFPAIGLKRTESQEQFDADIWVSLQTGKSWYGPYVPIEDHAAIDAAYVDVYLQLGATPEVTEKLPAPEVAQ